MQEVLNLHKVVNELRSINRGIEFRYNDPFFSRDDRNVIYVNINLSAINIPQVYTRLNDVLFINQGIHVTFKPIEEIKAGFAYPDVDVFSNVETVDDCAVLLQKINPTTCIFLSNENDNIYYYCSKEDLILPSNLYLVCDGVLSNGNRNFVLTQYDPKELVQYIPTSLNKIFEQKKYHEKDRRRSSLNNPYIGHYELKSISEIGDDILEEEHSVIEMFDDISDIVSILNLDDADIRNLENNLNEVFKDAIESCVRDKYACKRDCSEFLCYTLFSSFITLILLLTKDEGFVEGIRNQLYSITNFQELIEIFKAIDYKILLSSGLTVFSFASFISAMKQDNDIDKFIMRMTKYLEFNLQINEPLIRKRRK
ncbi:MAG: hypothetical protein R3Y13_02445 [bacterium]